jgi:hypothetical protein
MRVATFKRRFAKAMREVVPRRSTQFRDVTWLGAESGHNGGTGALAFSMPAPRLSLTFP